MMQITNAILDSKFVDVCCAIIGLCLLFTCVFLAILVTAFFGAGVWSLIEEIIWHWFR